MYPPSLSTAPEGDVVSLADAKAWLRYVDTDQDALITALVGAAVKRLDGWTGILGRCLLTQSWTLSYDRPARCLRLPFPDVGDITSIAITKAAGVASTVAASNYDLFEDAAGSYVRFKDAYSIPGDLAETHAVEIIFEAGFGAASDIPEDIKLAIKQMVAFWFEYRETALDKSMTDIPLGATAILAPYRRGRI